MAGHKRRRTGWVLAVLLVVSVGAGIGAAPAASATPWSDLAEAAGRLVGRAAEVSQPRQLVRSTRNELPGLGRSADDLLRQAPRPELLTTPERAVLHQVVVLRDLRDLVDQVAATEAGFPSEADAVAAATTRYSDVRADLTKSGTEILKDAACDAAFGLMTPGEQGAVDDSGQHRDVPDVIGAATRDAVVNYGERFVAGLLPGRNVLVLVQWGQWGDGILGKVQAVRDGLGGSIELPSQVPNQAATAPYVTRAFVYYVRTCLAPPG
jgi:hypothetical protein